MKKPTRHFPRALEESPRKVPRYFLTASLLSTAFTPFTRRAAPIAFSPCSALSTKPLSTTSPFRVSTLISEPLISPSAISIVFTLVVMTLSSIRLPMEASGPL